jgi:uncharacterized alpha-E superfamily protein
VTFGKTGAEREATDAAPAADTQVLTVMFDPQAPFGLADTITRARRLASIVRDRISIDTWRILSQLDREYQESHAPAVGSPASPLPARPPSPIDDLTDALDLLDRMVITLAAFTGLGTESMLRNQGWRFLDMGRRLERAVNTLDLMHTLTLEPDPNEGPVLDALLEVLASAMSYRQRYLAVPTARPAVDMLLLDETNPRSVAYQLLQLAEHLDQLPRGADDDRRLGADQRQALEMLTALRLAEPERLVPGSPDEGRDALGRLLLQIERGLPELSDAIARQFLSHNAVSARLGQAAPQTPDAIEPEEA